MSVVDVGPSSLLSSVFALDSKVLVSLFDKAEEGIEFVSRRSTGGGDDSSTAGIVCGDDGPRPAVFWDERAAAAPVPVAGGAVVTTSVVGLGFRQRFNDAPMKLLFATAVRVLLGLPDGSRQVQHSMNLQSSDYF